MTDKKKISILERLLNERDEQIQELQKQNVELQAMLDKYSHTDDDMRELKEIIEETRRLSKEYNEVKNEQIRMTKEYERDMERFMRKNKIKRNQSEIPLALADGISDGEELCMNNNWKSKNRHKYLLQ